MHCMKLKVLDHYLRSPDSGASCASSRFGISLLQQRYMNTPKITNIPVPLNKKDAIENPGYSQRNCNLSIGLRKMGSPIRQVTYLVKGCSNWNVCSPVDLLSITRVGQTWEGETTSTKLRPIGSCGLRIRTILQSKSILMIWIDIFAIRIDDQFNRINFLKMICSRECIIVKYPYLNRYEATKHQTQYYDFQHQLYNINIFNRIKIINTMAQQKQEKIDIRVHNIAYKKIVYHLLRYPTSRVTGVLVGKDKDVLDAYPLFHTPIVNPTFSVALDIIDSNLEGELKIIGLYEFVQGSQIKINSLIETNPQMKELIAMRVWANGQKEIKFGSAKFNFITPSWQIVEQGLRKGEYRFLVDFDAHFEEVELDFRNTYVQ